MKFGLCVHGAAEHGDHLSGRQPASHLHVDRLVRRLTGAMRAQRIEVLGRLLAPNHFLLAINPADALAIAPTIGSLREQITHALATAVAACRCTLPGPLQVSIEPDPSVPAGGIRLTTHMRGAVGERARADQTGSARVVLRGVCCSLDRDTITVGRGRRNDIVIADRRLARRHACLRRQAQGWEVRNLSTESGTFLNGQPIKQRQLRHGDTLCLGGLTILFLSREAP